MKTHLRERLAHTAGKASVVGAGLLAAGLALTSATAPASAADYTLKFATVVQNEPMHTFMKHYEKNLEAATDGRIDVKLFPGAQLGGPARLIEGVQLGTVEMLILACQHLRGVDKRIGVVEAPGLFSDIKHANRTYWNPAFRDPYLSVAEDKGVKGVAIYAYGPTAYQTVPAVETLDGFEGLKIRVLSTDIESRLMDTLDAAGIQVEWPDIVPALQRGQIDGVRANLGIAYASKFNTVAKNAVLTNETMIPVCAFMSTDYYSSLPESLQTAVMDVGRKTEQEMQEVAIAFNKSARENWEKDGGTVHTLSEEQQKELMRDAREISADVLGSDADMQNMFGKLRKASEETAK